MGEEKGIEAFQKDYRLSWDETVSDEEVNKQADKVIAEYWLGQTENSTSH
jgi:hypothetical protein